MIRTMHLRPASERLFYLISLFFLGCFLGFFWELSVYLFSHDKGFLTVLFQLRGVLHGPWVPIYGAGCVLLFYMGRLFSKKPVPFFLGSICMCGILVYFTSWILEVLFHARWWDYSDKFMNLHGRIYLLGLLFFGIAGMFLIYILEPVFFKFFCVFPTRFRTGICIILTVLFAIDVIASLYTPNLGIGVAILN